jgi:hypothetical protein
MRMSPGSSSYGTTNDLNRQALNRLNGPPSYPPPSRYLCGKGAFRAARPER